MKPRAAPPADITPEDFFTRWIGESVASDEARRAKLGDTVATIQFDLEPSGEDGEPGGTFSVDVANGVVSGRAEATPDAELRIEVDTATWRELNAGTIAAPEALIRRRLKMHGNFVLALKLHLILG